MGRAIRCLFAAALLEALSLAHAVQAPTRTVQTSASVNPQAVRNLQDAMSAGELEILRRYYVLGESARRISEVMGMNIAVIEAVKQRARQVRQKPLCGVATVGMPHCRVA